MAWLMRIIAWLIMRWRDVREMAYPGSSEDGVAHTEMALLIRRYLAQYETALLIRRWLGSLGEGFAHKEMVFVANQEVSWVTKRWCSS